MENVIKLAEALGWPIASSFVSMVLLIIVFRVMANKGELSFSIKDWFKFGTKAEEKQPILLAHSSDKLVLIEETTAETVAEVTETDPVSGPGSIFWKEKDAASTEASFDLFKEGESYISDPEFWESLYVDRRREISVGDELLELSRLVDQNPTWVWPLIFLIRRHVRLYDSSAAEAALHSALSRDNPGKRRWVLREGVTLYFRLFGFDKSIAFCREQVSEGALDIEVSEMFLQLADLCKIEEDPFSSALLREIGTSYNRSEKSALFDLAYSYGTTSAFRTIAFQRYAALSSSEKDWPNSPNNMGIAVEKISQSLGNLFFEDALSLKSGVAAANLARSLADDGYIQRAELVLKEVAELELSGKDASTLAAARAKVASARAKMETERKAFEEYASEQDRRYSSAILAAYSFYKRTGALHASGNFIDSEEVLTLSLDIEGASCIYKVGETTFSGRLPRKPLCYEGTVSATSGGILNLTLRHILVLQTGENQIRMIIWPEDQTKMDPIQVIEACRVELQPTLPDLLAAPPIVGQ